MISFWLLATGCGPGREACDAWIGCAATISEQEGAEAEARYERHGSCFGAQSKADCVAACEDELIGVWTFHRDQLPACDPNDVGLGEDLDEGTFVSGYAELYCSWWKTCNATDCPIGLEDIPCDGFDPALGEACLEGEWSCSGSAPEGESFPLTPVACSTVCQVIVTF